jgi:hypothetical protein
MIGIVVLALVVVGTQFAPWFIKRMSRGGPTEAAPTAEATAQAAAASAIASAPERKVEAPARGSGREPIAAAAVAELGSPSTEWMSQFAMANRDTSRSPFQRKNEGLGKVFIRSRPSGAEILINGIVMPRLTDWLLPVSFPAGRYVLELRKDGYNPYVTDLVIPKGLEDFEEITTINAALRNKPETSVQAVHRNLLYVRGQPPVQVSMIMHSSDSQSWAVIQRLPVCAGKKWVVTEGDEIEFSRATGGKDGEKEVFERIRIIRILPDVVTIRNLLINLDYDFPIGESWSARDHKEGAEKS